VYRRRAETPVPWESAGGVEPDRRVCSTSEEACLPPIICLSRGSSLHSAPFLRGGALHFNGLPHLASTSTVQVAALHCECAGPGLSVPERRSVRAERPEHPEGVPAAATVRVVHTTGRLIDAVRVMCRVALSQTSRPVNDLAADPAAAGSGPRERRACVVFAFDFHAHPPKSRRRALHGLWCQWVRHVPSEARSR
jgi:hypothetical protein